MKPGAPTHKDTKIIQGLERTTLTLAPTAPDLLHLPQIILTDTRRFFVIQTLRAKRRMNFVLVS